MKTILFDDVGSYPLPKDTNMTWINCAAQKNDPILSKIIKDAMQQKIDAGIDIPTYPQFRDMNQMFLDIMNNQSLQEEPFIVKKDKARILELSAIDDIGAEYIKKNGKKLNVKICVTGPIELYLRQFGGTSYKDILNNFAVSVDRFIDNSISNAKHFQIYTISIDEPSIGINSNIMFNDDDIIEALTIATKTADLNKIDTQIHLHSPLHYKIICKVPSIKIIGIESAANPSYLNLIDKKELEYYDKFLRIGITRTDIFKMATVLNEKHSANIWKTPEMLDEIVTDMETPQIIKERLRNIFMLFGDRIKYAGTDCGLSSFPSQELASRLLKNTRIGIDKFIEEEGNKG